MQKRVRLRLNTTIGKRRTYQDLYRDWESRAQAVKLRELGYKHLWDDQIDTALDVFRDAIGKDEGDYLTHFLVGMAYIKKGEHDRAIEKFCKVIELLDRQRYEKSLSDESKKLVKAYCHFYRGNEYFSKGEYENAIEDYEASFKLDDPTAGFFFTYIGYAYLYKSQADEVDRYIEKARESFEKAVELSPEDRSCYEALGQFCYQTREYDRSIGLYEKALKLLSQQYDRPDEADKSMIETAKARVYNLIGNAYYSKGSIEDYRESVDYYNRAIEKSDLAVYHANLARAFSQLRDLEKAEEACKKAVDKQPGNADHLATLGDIYYEIGEASFRITEQSMETLRSEGVPDDVLERLESIKDQDIIGEEKFIDILKKESGEEQAAQFGSLIVEHAKGDHQEAYENAAEQYKKALEADPEQLRYVSSLISACEKLKDPDKAISILEWALELKPDYDEIPKALRKLKIKRKYRPLPWAQSWEMLPVVTPVAIEVRGVLHQFVDDSLLFSLDLQFQGDLDEENVSEGLIQKFADNEVPLSQSATVSIKEIGYEWRIDDEPGMYIIIKEGDELNTYRAGRELMEEQLPSLREKLYMELGVRFPGVRFRVNETEMSAKSFIMIINEVPMIMHEIKGDYMIDADITRDKAGLEKFQLDGIETTNPIDGNSAAWIERDQLEKAQRAGYKIWDARGYMILALARLLRDHAADFIGIQETQNMLDQWIYENESHRSLVERVIPDVVDVRKLTILLKRLVDEGISVRDLQTILEAILKHGRGEHDVIMLAEKARLALKSFTQQRYTDDSKRVNAYFFARKIERIFKDGIKQEIGKSYLELDVEFVQRFLQLLREKIDRQKSKILITKSSRIRPYVRELTKLEFPDLAILSRKELKPGVAVKRVDTITIS